MTFDPEFDDDLTSKTGSLVRSCRAVIWWCGLIGLVATCVIFALDLSVMHPAPVPGDNPATIVPPSIATAVELPYHLIVNRETGQCLDVPFGSLNPRERIEQFPVNGGGNQQWRLEPAGGESVRIVNRHSGHCLDIPFGMREAGVVVEQFAINGGSNQGWKFVSAGDHWYRIENDCTGLCLEVPGGSTERRTAIEQARVSGGCNQHWRTIAVR